MILEELAAASRRRAAEMRSDGRAAQFHEAAEGFHTDGGRRFRERLAAPGLSFLCELKKASPSKGVIAESYPYLAIAREYEAAGAAAVSCLTEPDRFLGSMEHLRRAAAALAIPVLRKDFLTDECQIEEAALAGASAVLLIAAMLTDEALARLRRRAEALGLAALVEVHSTDELRRALDAGADIIGINHRDLRDFSMDLSLTERLRPLVPPGVLVVAESGMQSGKDVRRMREAGADAVLIGECLMRARDRGRAAPADDRRKSGRTEEQQMKGRFGPFGGQYVPETLMSEVLRVEKAYEMYKRDPQFLAELADLNRNYTGRPSLLYEAKRMSEDLGVKVYLKREDLNHTGAHKINNCIGQALLARRMGKTRLIAETGAGQHGVAAATVAALFGMECEVYMGEIDTERQALNVYRMRLLGAKVHAVKTGSRVLKDAVNAAMQDWSARCGDTHYLIGSAVGPAPFPEMVRDFQSCIGREMRDELLRREGRLPDAVVACVGGGSNAIGTFYPFIGDEGVRLIGCEAGGKGVDTPYHAATMARGRTGVFHGMKSLFCQDEDGNITEVYSISAGLDYPGVSPEHAELHETGRAEYIAVTDEEAVEAFEYLARTEGIICAIESAHAVAGAVRTAKTLPPGSVMAVTISGRGDKDVAAIARYRGEALRD